MVVQIVQNSSFWNLHAVFHICNMQHLLFPFNVLIFLFNFLYFHSKFSILSYTITITIIIIDIHHHHHHHHHLRSIPILVEDLNFVQININIWTVLFCVFSLTERAVVVAGNWWCFVLHSSIVLHYFTLICSNIFKVVQRNIKNSMVSDDALYVFYLRRAFIQEMCILRKAFIRKGSLFENSVFFKKGVYLRGAFIRNGI